MGECFGEAGDERGSVWVVEAIFQSAADGFEIAGGQGRGQDGGALQVENDIGQCVASGESGAGFRGGKGVIGNDSGDGKSGGNGNLNGGGFAIGGHHGGDQAAQYGSGGVIRVAFELGTFVEQLACGPVWPGDAESSGEGGGAGT